MASWRGIDRSDPRWGRLRSACSEFSTVDVDEHADHVYVTLGALAPSDKQTTAASSQTSGRGTRELAAEGA